MSDGYGRFTVRGSEAVERLMTELVNDAAARVREAFAPSEYRALVMIGGYGRGEGGVEVVDGVERPHNNVDFLMIAETARSGELLVLRERLLNALLPVMQQYAIEIDLSVVSVWKLRLSPALIIWYDMRFGHKTILGDSDFVPSLTRFRLEAIPSRDALRLLVNRGTLLVMNEQLLDEENGSIDHRRRITRNIMKAIIGYGDALLFFLGAYHWSYVERQKRVAAHADVPEDFRALYDEAAAFRFQPGYDRYASRDLREWMADLRTALEPVHRMCECRRLGVPAFTWDAYPRLAMRHALLDEALSARAWARKSVHLTRGANPPPGLGFRARLGYRVMGVKDRSLFAFPLLAYHLDAPSLQAFAAAALNEPAGAGMKTLREAYLRLWCAEIDINAGSALRKWRMPAAEDHDKRAGRKPA
jgi:hypothetical protein